jgi:cellobiose phosphorylase
MKYGSFDDDRREYVIHTPYTPLPWINYLGNKDFFSLISNTGGGYSFYRDAKLRRITRYRYNNAPGDSGGRLYYINDGGNLWSPAFLPLKTPLDSYCCRHGMGYTLFESRKNGLSASLLCFVPLDEPCEINRLTLINQTDLPKTVRLTACVEWCLWNAVDDANNFQRNYSTGELEQEDSVIYHKTEYRERRNHYAYYAVNCDTTGYDTDRDTFLGRFNGYDAPDSVMHVCSADRVSHGWAPIAAHHISLTLQPGEVRSLVYVLGYAELDKEDKWQQLNVINKSPAKALLERFNTSEKTDEALKRLNAYWNGLLERFTVISGDEKLNRMVNIWNPYQCMVTFNLSRSASYFESGTGRGMGFRDSCQDILGFVHLVPERARQRILDIAAIQLSDGSAWHQYQPLTKQGNADVGGGFNDDPLWLVASVYAYIAETGDASILEEPVPFDTVPGTEASLFEHLRRSVQYTLSHLGPHGLPLIGRADWNDCLNLNCFSEEPGESFQTTANYESGIAESVFIAAMFVLYAGRYAKICDRYGDPEEAAVIREAVETMKAKVLEHGWDGEWFLRAYDAFGAKVGSNECEEGKIYIEPQGFCVLAGIGIDGKHAQKALASVRVHLAGEFGISLLWPCYSVYHKELGEVSSYPPGYKENGGIFCHNNPWISIAEAVTGNAWDAYEAYRRICPAYLEEMSDTHRTEPYVYSQMIAGQEAPTPGEAKNSWLTGTAAWTFVNVSQYLLGLQPELEGLRLCPCLPEQFDAIHIIRAYREAIYDIRISRSIPKGMYVDGQPAEDTLLPVKKGLVKVSLGI